MKTFISGGHTFRIELFPNQDMASVHTTVDLSELRSNVESAHALTELNKIPGVEPKGIVSDRKSRYELHVEIGRAFDRTEVCYKIIVALAAIVDPRASIIPYDQHPRPFTVVGAYNNYSAYGPDMNGDGEIKLEHLCFVAHSDEQAIYFAQEYLRTTVEIKEACENDDRDQHVLDQPFAIEGNPLGLIITNEVQ